ncbi:MAG: hypothetical protein K8S27_14205 [Candidatus Omnitrophica bacterium]|nr:hypothetical protein [Candidatus Omnitrophota bacterium]
MKTIQFKRLINQNKRTKLLSVTQCKEDASCITRMRKNFFYNVVIHDDTKLHASKPQIYIKKTYDTKTRSETFSFRVKGFFYMKHKRYVLRVHFRHFLNIHIQWKTKIFSPSKSEILT